MLGGTVVALTTRDAVSNPALEHIFCIKFFFKVCRPADLIHAFKNRVSTQKQVSIKNNVSNPLIL